MGAKGNAIRDATLISATAILVAAIIVGIFLLINQAATASATQGTPGVCPSAPTVAQLMNLPPGSVEQWVDGSCRFTWGSQGKFTNQAHCPKGYGPTSINALLTSQPSSETVIHCSGNDNNPLPTISNVTILFDAFLHVNPPDNLAGVYSLLSNVILLLTFLLGVAALVSLFVFGRVRRNGQAQLALGLYLLAIGSALAFLTSQLWPGFAQNDAAFQTGIFGLWYLLVGIILLLGSLIGLRGWISSWRMGILQALLLAVPGIIFILVLIVVRGPSDWEGFPLFGLDIIVSSWVVGIGIFMAGRRLASRGEPAQIAR